MDKSWNPVKVFELFFDDEVIKIIVDETLEYAKQCGNHEFKINKIDLKKFFAVLLLSGYSVLPRRRMYWERMDDVFNPAVANSMSRKKFEDCLRYLHLANNNNLDRSDRFAKIRPLMSLLNKKWLLYFPRERNLSIDESMVPYYGRHSLKQHIHGKPIRFGYKVWCLCTPLGYLAQAESYQGDNTGYSTPGLGMGGSVVVDLCSELPRGIKYNLYFDNLFTSLPLLDHLSEIGLGGTGTIRVNRTEKAPLADVKHMKRMRRGEYCFVKDSISGAILVRWNDKNIVTLASNIHGVVPVGEAKRWSHKERKEICVQQPHVVTMYNKNMGGVDRLDHNISKLRIGIRSKKWWWPMFSWMLNVTVQNSWQIYRRLAVEQNIEKLDFLQFTRRIVLYYLAQNQEKTDVQVKSSSRTRVSNDVRFDGRDHLVIPHPTQVRCAHCHLKVKRKCRKCNVGLHVDCFVTYHTSD